jgi:23S rRNA (cytosine1962-C5)-methyltransferase
MLKSIHMDLLQKTLDCRADLFDPPHQSAFRLFNGFTEGLPGLAVDLYASTLLIHNLADPPSSLDQTVQSVCDFYLSHLPWLQAVVLKTRHSTSREDKCGRLLFGTTPADRVCEQGIWYSLGLLQQQDAGLYLDTRHLRKWLIDHLQGKTLLNTFAYTGSLGIAALAGGASHVVQLDRSRIFLDFAKTSCTLNGFPVEKSEYLVGDFYPLVSRLKRTGELFDCVVLDPPFFSTGSRGDVNLEQDSPRLINKLRPLVRDSGWLVAINNALYVSGQSYLSSLEALCSDGYLSLEKLIPVPDDFTGYPGACQSVLPVDPAPFNHPTKIALLRVKRKQP